MAHVAVNVSRPNYASRLIARALKAFEVKSYDAKPETTILLLNDVELAKRGLDRDNLVALATRGLY